MFAQEFLGILGGVIGIVGQHAQIQAFLHRKRGLIAQHDVEEFEALDMPPQHHKAHGQRGGEQQADGPPQPGPEHGGHNHRHGGKTHAAAIDKRLDHLTDSGFHAAEQRHRPGQHGPAGIHRHRQKAGKQERDGHADVRHKAEQHADQAPQAGIGNADQPKADADDDAERRVDRGLQEQIARQAVGGFVQRHGGALHVARTGQADKAVAQVILLQKNETDKHQHQRHQAQRLQQRAQHILGQGPGRHGFALHHHRHRRIFGDDAAGDGGGTISAAIDLFANDFDGAVEAAEGAAAGGAADGKDFVRDIVLVAGQVARQPGDLRTDKGADSSDQHQRHHQAEQHRRHMPQPHIAQHAHQGRQGEGQQHRQGQRHQDGAPDIEPSHDHGENYRGHEFVAQGRVLDRGDLEVGHEPDA